MAVVNETFLGRSILCCMVRLANKFVIDYTLNRLIICIGKENKKITGFVLSGRAVATPYLGMTLVFFGFGRFHVSETAIKQNLKLMREMQSTGQTDPTESIRCLQMCPRAQGRISEKPHIFLSSSSSSFFFLYPRA